MNDGAATMALGQSRNFIRTACLLVQLCVAAGAGVACAPVDGEVTARAVNSTIVATPAEVVGDGNAAATIVVTVLGTGNAPRPGLQVALASSLVGSAVTPASGVTDANGQVTGTVRSFVPGVASLTARLGGPKGQALAATTSVTFVSQAPALQLVAEPAQAVANNDAEIALRVQGPALAGPVHVAGLAATDVLTPDGGSLDANGTFTATLRARLAAARALTVTAGGQSATADVRFVAGPVDPTRTAMRLAQTTGAGDGTESVQLEVLLYDAFRNPVSGEPVSLSEASGLGNTVIFPLSGVTDASGVFVAHVSSQDVGAITVQAVTAGATVAQPLTFVPGRMAPERSSLVGARTVALADGNHPLDYQLTARDAAGHLLAGRAVTFAASAAAAKGFDLSLQPASATTDLAGQANVRLNTAQAANYVLRAGVDDAALTTAARFVPGPVAQAHCTLVARATELRVGGPGSGTTLAVTVRDAHDNAVPGQTVTFRSDGSAPSWGATQVVSDANGVAQTTLASTVAGNHNVTATVLGAGGGADATLQASVRFVPAAAAAAASTLLVQAQNVVANGTDGATLAATLADAYGNPLVAQPLTLRSDEPTDVWTNAAGVSGVQGDYAATLRATRAGLRTVTLQAAGLQLTALVRFVPGPLALARSSLSVEPNALVADNVATTALTVRLRDAQDNALAGVAVMPSLSASGATFVPTTGVTDANGMYVAQLRGQVAGSQQLRAYVGDGGAALQANVRFLPGPAASAQCSLVVSPNAVAANGVASASVVAYVRDALGNALGGTAVDLHLAAPGGTLAQASGTTDPGGAFITSVTSPVAGTRLLTASSGNATFSAPLTFVPTAPSATTSSVTLSPNVAVANDVDLVGVVVNVRDAQQNPVGGANVTLASSGSGFTFAAPTGQADANGVYVTTLRSRVAEAKQVSATLPQGASVVATATFVAGEANVATSSLRANPNVAEAGSGVSVQATLRDALGNPVPGKTVQFASDDAQGLFAPTTAVTNAAGVASSSFVATAAGSKQLTATAGSLVLATQVTYDVGDVSGGVTRVTASPNVQVADDASLVALTVQIVDAYGNPAAGQNVQLMTDNAGGNDTLTPAAGVLNAQGTFSATLRSTKAEAKVVRFVAAGLEGNVPVTFVAGEPNSSRCTVSVDPAAPVADDVATTTVTVVARDVYGNPVPDYAVALSASGAANGFAAAGGNTDVAGTYTTTLRSSVAQQKQVVATLGSAASATASVTFVAGPAADATSSLSVSPNQLVADNMATATVSLLAADALGNPVTGANVTLTSDGDAVFAATSGVTDASGAFATTVRSTVARTELLQTTLAGAAGPNQMLRFVAGAPNASRSSLTVPTGGVVADGVATAPLTVVVRDFRNNVVPGAAVSLSVSGSGAVLDASSGATDANGSFVTNLRSTAAESKLVTVTAGAASFSSSVAFVAGAPVPANSALVASPNVLAANDSSVTTLTATLRDAYANPVPGVAVTLWSSGSGDTLTPASGTTDAAGHVVATLRSRVAETKQLRANFASGNVTTSLVTTPGSPNSAASTLTASPNVQVADNVAAVTVVASVRDRLGNPVPGIATTLASSNAGDSVAPANQTTDAAGQVSFAVRSSRAEHKILTLSAGSATVSVGADFVAGAPAVATSTLAVTPGDVVADNVATATLTASLRDAFANPVPGVAVAFAVGGAGGTLASPSGPSDANGVVTTTLRATVAETKSITAAVGTSGVQLSGSVRFVAGAPNAAHSQLVCAPATFVADDAATTTVTASVRDAYDNLVPSAPVTLSSSGAGNTFAAAGGSTSSAGTYVTTLRSSVAQIKTVAASLGSGSGSVTCTVTATAGPPNAATTTLVLSPNVQVADNGQNVAVTATVRDRFGNLVPGQAVSLASSNAGGNDTLTPQSGSTDAAGSFVATWRSNRAEAKSLTLTAGGAQVTAPATFTAGAPVAATSQLDVSPASFVANNVAFATLTATLRDVFGNLVPGRSVSFAASGTGNTVAALGASTDANGVLAATLRSSKAEAKIASATVAGFTLSANVTTTAGAAASAQSTLVASPNVQVADGSATVQLTGRVADAFGNPVPGAAVQLASSNGNDLFTPASGAADGNGVFVATVRSTRAEAKTLTLTSGAASAITQATFVAGSPNAALTTTAVSPNSVVADNTSTSGVTVTVRDAFANPVTGQAVCLTSSGSGATFAAANGNTSAAGAFVTTLRSTKAETKVITAAVQAGAGSFAQTANVTFVAGAPNATLSTWTATPTAVATGGNTTTLALALVDRYGNPVPGQGASVSTAATNVTYAPSASLTTDAAGLASVQVASTTAQAATLTATSGAVSLGANVLFYVAGQPLAATSSVNFAAATVPADNTSTTSVTVRLRDGGGNPVAAAAVALSTPPLGVTFNVARGSSDASGTFTSLVRSYNAGAAPIRARTGSLALANTLQFTATTPRCNGRVRMGAYPAVASGSAARDAVTGDFDRNGSVDIATLSPFRLNVSLNDGNANFTAKYFGPGTDASAIAAVDVNNDRNLDLVTVNQNTTASLTYWRNPGDGNFYVAQTLATASGAASVAAGDFNGDGYGDVAVVGSGNAVVVHMGSASGFAAGQALALPAVPYAVTVGDLNLDQKADLVVASATTSTLFTLLGGGDGTFAAARAFAAGYHAGTPVVGDVDGDAIPDVVTARYVDYGVDVSHGNGDGTLGAPTYFDAKPAYTHQGARMVALADLNQDGNVDLLLGTPRRLTACRGNGHGTFVCDASQLTTSASPGAIATADFNGDGYPDAVHVIDQWSDVAINDGSGNFLLPRPIAVAGLVHGTLADVDGDGKLDLVSALSTAKAVGLHLGRGDATFAAPSTLAANANVNAVAALDNNTVAVYRGTGNGNFAAPVAVTTPGMPTSLLIADLSGDGVADVAYAGNATFGVLAGVGTGGLGAPKTQPLAWGPTELRAADINGDGLLDVVASGNGTFAWLTNTGGFNFGTGTLYVTGGGPVGIGDVDGDGAIDTVAARSNQTTTTYFGDGAGGMRTSRNDVIGTGAMSGRAIAVVADVNGDGVADLLTWSTSINALGVVSGQGDGTYATSPAASAVFPAAGLVSVRNVLLGDLTGDGTPDVVMTSPEAYAVLPQLGCP